MLLAGIGEPIQQLIPVRGVMGAIGGEGGQSLAAAEVIEPVAAPGTVVEQAMEITHSDAASLESLLPPTQAGLLHQWHQIVIGHGAAMVQFKAPHFGSSGPSTDEIALLQGFFSAESGLDRQQSEPFTAGGSPLQLFRSVQLPALHLQSSTETEKIPA